MSAIHDEAFPPTRQSVLVSLKSHDRSEAAHAKDVVARVYWQPVYRHLRVRWRKSAEESREATQSFFAVAFERASLACYDPSRGRFRAFLKTCLDRFVSNEGKAERRLKRGGAFPFRFDFDAVEAELATSTATPEDLLDAEFDRAWASMLLHLAVSDLRERCLRQDKALHFSLFERYVLDGDDGRRPTYAELATECGVSVSDVTNHLAWARREFRKLVLERLRTITSSEEEFDLEARTVLGLR
jgi:DNA-directed RNA polymerase specialized sigma24 family protein